MSAPVILEGLDLAALLCSRVCHDLISPVGAVVNGIEVMEDDVASRQLFRITSRQIARCTGRAPVLPAFSAESGSCISPISPPRSPTGLEIHSAARSSISAEPAV